MIALYENQPVSARVRLTDDDYLRTRYYLHPHGTADITVGRGRDWTVLACKECYGKAVKTVLDLSRTAASLTCPLPPGWVSRVSTPPWRAFWAAPTARPTA